VPFCYLADNWNFNAEEYISVAVFAFAGFEKPGSRLRNIFVRKSSKFCGNY
jgi:hypothetical protein